MNKFLLLLTLIFSSSQISANHFLTYIIPCYNCENWIGQAIESIYQQDLDCPFEIICTNDASTDTTQQTLQKLAEIYPEMVIYTHDFNQGGGAARNTCISHSKGNIIFCLDSDNVLSPNSVKKLIHCMDMTGCDIVTCGTVRYFSENFNIVGTLNYKGPNERIDLEYVLTFTDSPIWSGNYLYTRKSYDEAGGYPTQYGALDTFTFGFNQLVTHSTMAYVPDVYYWHRHGIESYYMRESRSNRINLHFIEFMLSLKHLFTDYSISFLQYQKGQALNGEKLLESYDYMFNKLLILKNQ